MPGTLPGFLGVAAFGGIRFVGYPLAVSGLEKFEPAVTSSTTKIAGVRTGLGFVLHPIASICLVFLASFLFLHLGGSPGSSNSNPPMFCLYGVLFVVRIFVWALVLFLFTRRAPLPGSGLRLYPLPGAIVSSLQTWPGYALAIRAPGKLTFC